MQSAANHDVQRELDIIPFDINVRIEDESAFVQNSGVTSGVISTVGEQDASWKKRNTRCEGHDCRAHVYGRASAL